MATVPAVLSPRRVSAVRLRSGGALVLAMRLTAAAALFGLQVLLARSLGDSGYGLYAFAMAWVQGMAVFGKAGLENTTLRQIPGCQAADAEDRLAAFLAWSRRRSLITSLLASVLLVLLTVTVIGPHHPGARTPLLIGSVALPLLTMRQIHEARLRAVHRVWQSLVGPAAWPLLMALILLLFLLSDRWHLTPAGAIGIQAVALAACSLLVVHFLRQALPSAAAPHTVGEVPTAAWQKASLTFLAFDAVILLRGRTSVIIAGMLIDTDTAGVYAIAEKIAEVVTLGVVSINMFAAPHFASLHASGQRNQLRELIRGSQYLGLLFAVPCAAVLAVFGRSFLGLIGPGYIAGYPYLVIMLASVTIGSLAGPAAYVLAMSGRERVILHGAILCMVINLAGSFSLATLYGATGLAVTHLITMLVWTLFMLWHLRAFQQAES